MSASVMRYSATTNGFYANDIDYASVPDDCVSISIDDYALLMDGQPAGYVIAPGADGYPMLIPA